MQALDLAYNSLVPKKVWYYFVFLELIAVLSSVLLSCNIAYFLLLAATFLLLVLLDDKMTLIILIALSTFINYQNVSILALWISVVLFILAAILFRVFFRSCLNQVRTIKSKLNLPLTIFLTITLFNVLRGLFYSYKMSSLALESFVYLSLGLIFLVTDVFKSLRDIKNLFNILVLLTIVQSIYGVTNYLIVGHRIGGTLFGIIPNMVAIVLLNLSFYSPDRRKRRLYLLLLFPAAVHLIFSFTRGYWFGFIGGLIFSYAYYVSQRKYKAGGKIFNFLKGLIVVFSISVVILLSLQFILPGGNFIQEFTKRFKSSFSASLGRETVSNYARVLEYREAVEKIKEKPVHGFGLGYRFEYFNPLLLKRESVYAVHNDYLAIILKMGLVGLTVFLWLFYVFFREGLQAGRRTADPYSKGLIAGFSANILQILLVGFTNHVIIGVMNTFYLAFAMGAVVVLSRNEKPREKVEISAIV